MREYRPDDSDFAGLRLATGEARSAPLRADDESLLGFGGANTCMILSSTPRPAKAPLPPREVFITGIGVALPGAMGNQAFLTRLADSSAGRATRDAWKWTKPQSKNFSRRDASAA